MAKEPKKEPKKPVTKRNHRSGWVAFLGAILIFLIPQIVVAGIFAATGYIDFENIDSLTSRQTFILYGATELLVLFFLLVFLKLTNKGIKYLGVTKKNLNKIWYAFPAYGVYFVLSAIGVITLSKLVSEDVLDKAQDIGFETSGNINDTILAFVALVIIAPIAEELLFRGFLFKGLKKAMDYRIAVFISALMFGVAHGQLNVGVDTFALGIVLAWLMHETDNIAVPIVLHMGKNLLAFLLLFVFQVA